MAQERSQRPPSEKGAMPGAAGPRPTDERSVGELFRELGNETQTLIQQEFQLVRMEAEEKARKASQGAGWVVAGGLVAYGGFLALIAALAFALGTVMPLWASFLIAGVIVLGSGYAVVQTGMSYFKNTDFSFNHTAASLEEDKTWIQQEAEEVKNDPAHLGAERRR